MTPPSSGYTAGQTLLFDVVADMAERHGAWGMVRVVLVRDMVCDMMRDMIRNMVCEYSVWGMLRDIMCVGYGA